MYALISPQAPAYCLSSWMYNKQTEQWTPVYSPIENSCYIAEVAPAGFEVAPPLFWKECGDEVTADFWYLDSVTDQFVPIPPPAPLPNAAPDQAPTVAGAQTL